MRDKHRLLPVHPDGYFLEPKPVVERGGLGYGSLPGAIVDGQTQTLAFAHLGDLPLMIRKSTLGYPPGKDGGHRDRGVGRTSPGRLIVHRRPRVVPPVRLATRPLDNG